MTASQPPPAIELIETAGLDQERRGPKKSQRRPWGWKPANEWERQEANQDGGDGRIKAARHDRLDAEELRTDVLEENEIVVEQAKILETQNKEKSKGHGYWEQPQRLDPLWPRVRDWTGCLLDGPIKPRQSEVFLASALIINLDERPDRWNYISNTSGAQTLRDLRRWSGVKIRSKDDVDKLEDRRREVALDKMAHTDGRTGLIRARDSWDKAVQMRYFAKLSCWMSHWETINYLAQQAQDITEDWARRNRIYLVTEDDWEIFRDINGLIPDIAAAVGEDWDAIRLDCWLYGTKDGRPRRVNPNYRVFRTGARLQTNLDMNYGGSQAVLYRAASIKKVAQYWRNEPFREADQMFWTDKIKTFCVNWGILHRARWMGSDVNHVTNGTTAHEIDVYDQYIRRARLLKSEPVELKSNSLEIPTPAQVMSHRMDHLLDCKKRRTQRRLQLRRHVKPR